MNERRLGPHHVGPIACKLKTPFIRPSPSLSLSFYHSHFLSPKISRYSSSDPLLLHSPLPYKLKSDLCNCCLL